MAQKKDTDSLDHKLELQISDEDEDVIVLSHSKVSRKAITPPKIDDDKVTQELRRIKKTDDLKPFRHPSPSEDALFGLADEEPLVLLEQKLAEETESVMKFLQKKVGGATLDIPGEPGEPVMLLDNQQEEKELMRSLLDADEVPWKTGEASPPGNQQSISLFRAPASSEQLPAAKKGSSSMRDTRPIPNVPRPVDDASFLPDIPFAADAPFAPDAPFSPDAPFHQDKKNAHLDQEIKVGILAPGATREDDRPSDRIFLEGLLSELHRHCARVCCFLVRGGLIFGFEARGEGDIEKTIQDVLFPADAPSIFSEVIRSKTPYHGPLPNTAMDQIVVACLGEQPPQRVAVYPVQHGDLVTTLFYLDDSPNRAFPDDTAILDQLLSRASLLEIQWQPPDLEELLDTPTL